MMGREEEKEGGRVGEGGGWCGKEKEKGKDGGRGNKNRK